MVLQLRVLNLRLAFEGILDATDDILNLAFSLVDPALLLEFGISGQATSGFLGSAAHVSGGALHPVFVHHSLLGM